LANTQSMERPGSLGGLPSLKTALAAITGVMMLVDLYLIFMVAPTDSVLGHVQRVFYFHVPIAIMSFLAFFVVFIGSLMYLIKRTPKWDAVAHASAEVGVVFVTLALLTGIIWARPVWNTWWTWEPRLTTTMILWLIYVAYLIRSLPVQRRHLRRGRGHHRFHRCTYRLLLSRMVAVDPSFTGGGAIRPVRCPGRNHGADTAVLVDHVHILLRLHDRGTDGTPENRRGVGAYPVYPTAQGTLGPALSRFLRKSPRSWLAPSSNLPYLFAAFAVSWVVLFGYLFYVNRRQHEMKKEIARLQSMLDRADEEE